MSVDNTAIRDDVEIAADDGTVLRGWFYRPAAPPPWSAIVMAHGFGVPKELQLAPFAETFAAAGFAVIVYDHRNVGASDGEPRQELDPQQQISDARDVITWICARDDTDADRIGVWGTSYMGGHVLVLGATDRRVCCVVSQVPTISGLRNSRRRFPGDAWRELQQRFAADRAARHDGADPQRVPQVATLTADDLTGTEDVTSTVDLGNDLRAWISANPADNLHGFRNDVTLRSLELYAAYEPGAHVANIGPTPLLMICMDDDPVTPTDEILAAYERAREPKRLLLLDGGHCDVYGRHRHTAADAARDWFARHLLG